MKNSSLFLLCCSILFSSCNFFQPISPEPEAVFIKFFGGSEEQEGVSVQLLNEDTTFVFGHIRINNLNQLYLIQIDREGNEVWANTLTDPESVAVDMKLTDNKEHLLLMSESVVTNGLKLRLTKTDLNGSVVWNKVLNTTNNLSYEASRISTINGTDNFLIIGTETNPTGVNGNPITRIYVAELDLDGNFIWEKTYNFTDRQAEYGVDVQAFSGNIIVLGRSVGLDGRERPIIIEAKRTSIGEELQSEIIFQNDNNNTIPNIFTAKEMLLGNTNEFLLLCHDRSNGAIVQVDISSEDRITSNTPNFLNFEMFPERFTQTQNNDLLITGSKGNKVSLMRVTPQGQDVWSDVRLFGTGTDIQNNTGHQAIEKVDGSILTVGTISLFDKKMIGVIKTNAAGELK